MQEGVANGGLDGKLSRKLFMDKSKVAGTPASFSCFMLGLGQSKFLLTDLAQSCSVDRLKRATSGLDAGSFAIASFFNTFSSGYKRLSIYVWP